MSIPLPHHHQAMRSPCRPEAAPPLLLVTEDGGCDDVKAQCRVLGIQHGDRPRDGRVCILAGPAETALVRRGLSPPYSGFVEIGGAGLLGVGLRCFDTMRSGGLALSLTTGAAYSLNAMELASEAVRRDFGIRDGEHADMIDICLAEAIGNAVIHGNLGIPGHLRATPKGFQRFCLLMQEQLADPVLSRRRLELNMQPRGPGLVFIAVTDQGSGFDLEAQLARGTEADGTHGRGLGLIRKACSALHAEDGGRTIVMSFSR